jgi:hypothetical protein
MPRHPDPPLAWTAWWAGARAGLAPEERLSSDRHPRPALAPAEPGRAPAPGLARDDCLGESRSSSGAAHPRPSSRARSAVPDAGTANARARDPDADGGTMPRHPDPPLAHDECGPAPVPPTPGRHPVPAARCRTPAQRTRGRGMTAWGMRSISGAAHPRPSPVPAVRWRTPAQPRGHPDRTAAPCPGIRSRTTSAVQLRCRPPRPSSRARSAVPDAAQRTRGRGMTAWGNRGPSRVPPTPGRHPGPQCGGGRRHSERGAGPGSGRRHHARIRILRRARRVGHPVPAARCSLTAWGNRGPSRVPPTPGRHPVPAARCRTPAQRTRGRGTRMRTAAPCPGIRILRSPEPRGGQAPAPGSLRRNG